MRVTSDGARIGILTDSYTRPANTTQYTIGDTISDSATVLAFDLSLNGISQNGTTGIIVQAFLISSAYQSTGLNADLLLFDRTVTVPVDNAACAITDAELLTCVARISFETQVIVLPTTGVNGNCIYVGTQVNEIFECKSDDDVLYGVLVARNAYTPISGEVFTVKLKVIQDA